ncbi:MAG TPA: transposase family protein, partial [Myxococcaceae bacterium]|nr:transposase family protein [Myxococcaceae bacterium]
MGARRERAKASALVSHAVRNGIRSHDTFGRVFAALDPEAFSRCFMGWMRSVSGAT